MTPTLAQIDAAIEYADMQRLLWKANGDGEKHHDLRENYHRKNEQIYGYFIYSLRALRLLVDAHGEDSDIIKAGTPAAGFVGAEFKTVETWDAMRSKLLEKVDG